MAKDNEGGAKTRTFVLESSERCLLVAFLCVTVSI